MMLFEGGKDSGDQDADMKGWMDWMKGLADHVTDGLPFTEKGKRVSGEMDIQDYDGSDADAISGYITVKADSLEDAAKLVEGCPLLAQGGIVEVRELKDMPM